MTMPDFSDHNIWRLQLTVGMRGLDAVFFNPNSGECVPYLSRRWRCGDSDVLGNIENAVYDDPLLLDDYDTSILICPKATLFVPPAMVDADDPATLRNALEPLDSAEYKDVWCEPIGEALGLYSTPGGIKDFLGRSFLTEDVHHLMSPFVKHFRGKAQAESGEKMWVHLGLERMDTLALRNGELLSASFRYCTPGPDALYYILFAWDTLGFDPSRGELRVSGLSEYRGQVMEPLRRHINYVSITVNSSAVSKALAQGLSMSQALALFKN